MNFEDQKMGLFLKALEFSAEKHKLQRRKGYNQVPYINHPIKVCHLLYMSEEKDIDLLIAALLHDTLEDTSATEEEIALLFGKPVLEIVLEVTDNMELPYAERKQKQIDKAPFLSDAAKKLKIADKICNIHDIVTYPLSWANERKIAYLEWAKKVVERCKGANAFLDLKFDREYTEGMSLLGRSHP